MTLDIPDSAIVALGLSAEEARKELNRDLAFSLYTRGVLSSGKAAEMLGITRMGFERLLYEHRVVRPYSVEDLEQDLVWTEAHRDEP